MQAVFVTRWHRVYIARKIPPPASGLRYAVVVKARAIAVETARGKIGKLISAFSLSILAYSRVYNVFRTHCAFESNVMEGTQKRDAIFWPLHRMQGLPSVEERMNLLDDFIEAHRFMTQQTIGGAFRVNGGQDNFDFAKNCLVIDLRYCVDCGGNPALAFQVEDARFQPISEVLSTCSAVRDSWEAGEALRRESERLGRTCVSSTPFLGVLMVLWRTREFSTWIRRIWHRMRPAAVDGSRVDPHWLEILQDTAKHGIVFRRTSEDIDWEPGQLKKVGSHWKWQMSLQG